MERAEADRGGLPAPGRGTGVAPLGAMLLAVAMLPGLVFFVGAASSLAVGTALAAGVVALLAAAYPNRLKPPLRTSATVFAALALAICFHLAVSSLFHPVEIGHALASFAPLLAVMIGGSALTATIETATDARIDSAMRLVFWSMCGVVVLQRTGFTPPFSDHYLKPYFPFTEPSHFVLAFMPVYTYVCIAASLPRRLALLGLGLVLILMLESLTLAVGWVVVVLSCTRGLTIPAVIAALLVGALSVVDLSYFVDRLDFSGGSQNLSTLVWLQGWQLTDEAFRITSGWGAGFQQLGLQGTNTDISRLIYVLVGDDANILDGGFGAAKLLSEFGVIGVGIIIGLTFLAGRSMLTLRTFARTPGSIPKASLFIHAVFVGYLVEMFVRGAGYFTGSAILLVAALHLRARLASRSRHTLSSPAVAA
ncbi:hypothetical protein [Glacieibacterium sp.]|uniref:hypothetical protein n=1 Tax=Glacieibacterium sp. TaxID=2860237 RepID=UPI003B004DCC